MSDPKPAAATAKSKAFKPRAGIVRKSKAEREAHAREEAEKAAARAAAAAQAAGKSAQNTRSSTAKKREAPKDNRDGNRSVASGVFGTGSGTRQSWKKAAVDGGRSEMLDGQEGIKPADRPALQGHEEAGSQKKQGGGGGGGGGGTTVGGGKSFRAAPDALMIDSDDEPDEHRRDIENICIGSEEEVEDDVFGPGKGKARAFSEGRRTRQGEGLRPVRAPRTLAEEQEGDERKGERKILKSSRIVTDDGEGHDEIDDMEVEEEQVTEQVHVKQDIPSSPELSKRTKQVRKTGPKVKDSKLATETVEERAERLRLDEDVEKLREELFLLPKVKKDKDVEHDNAEARPDRRLFLFQFPPLVPFLVDQAVKSQAEFDEKQEAVASVSSLKSDPDDASKDTSKVAQDDSGSVQAYPKTQMEGMLTASEKARLPPGRVGKLKVHKSGKVTLDWGGTDMEVRYGTEVDFLQDAVLVESLGQSNDNEDKNSAVQGGTTYALGQVQKKMVVIPDWQKLYD